MHIPKIPRRDYNKSQVKRLIDIEAKLRAGKGKGYQIWAERNNIDAKSQMIIFLKEHHIDSIEELNERLSDMQEKVCAQKSLLGEKQSRMKEINSLRKAIRDYSRTKDVYVQYRESGWSPQFYHDHHLEIEAHKSAQAVYSSMNGTVPTLKELTEEYDSLKRVSEKEKTALDALIAQLKDLKQIRYNYDLLERDVIDEKKPRSRSANMER